MDNHNKIVEQFKNAAHRQESKDFDAMDKVWSRVAEKLDKKVLKKENNLWKKIAVAASFLLIFTLGYQLFKTKEEIILPSNQQELVIMDSVKTNEAEDSEENAIVNTDVQNLLIKQNAEQILRKQMTETEITMAAPAPVIAAASESVIEEDAAKDKAGSNYEKRSSGYLRGNVYDAVGVRRDERITTESPKSEAKAIKKSDPLVVIDGKPITTKNSTEKTVKEALSEVGSDDLEEIMVLKEPLYIINGSHYSELELFGPNPTSPYAPLNRQDIETLTVLQGEKATNIYGERGAKGVVIITTKNGKPSKPTVTKDK